uniref:Uncharacterized protein n=1 Tax=Stomoxys calcitrans TaxID=35570 RepID=A0A1I8PLJ7_STOCA
MITKGRYLADVVLVLARTLDKEAEFQFLVHFRPVKGEKSVKFLDVKLNVCDVLSKTSSVPLLKTLMDEVRRKGNLPYDCPMKGNYLYSLVNYSLDASLLPAYAPILAFNFTWTVFEYQKKIGCLGISGATVPRN